MATQINKIYPWRYHCPDCGSVQILKIQGKSRKDPYRHRGKNDGDYKCDNCHERKRDLVDKKTGNLAKP